MVGCRGESLPCLLTDVLAGLLTHVTACFNYLRGVFFPEREKRFLGHTSSLSRGESFHVPLSIEHWQLVWLP